MKRSRVNAIIAEADAFMRGFGQALPPFAYLTPDQMRDRRAALSAIIDARLGWDVTDYGQGDFDRKGRFLFTARNGGLAGLARGEVIL